MMGWGRSGSEKGKDFDGDNRGSSRLVRPFGKDWTLEPEPEEPQFEPKTIDELLENLQCPRGLHEHGFGSFRAIAT